MMTDQGNRGDLLPADILRLVVGATGDHVFVLDADGRVLEEPGATRREARDSQVGTLWPDLFADRDRDLARAALADASGGRRTRFEGLVDGGSGETRWSATLVRLDAAQGAPRVIAVCRNVTAEHAVQAALAARARLHRAMVEATSEIVWHLDARNGLVHREGWAEFTGTALPPDDPHRWLAFVHPEDSAAAMNHIRVASADRRPYVVEYRLRHHTGAWRWMEDHAVPILGEDGAVTDWVGVVSDVQDRKATEDDLRQSALSLRLAIESTGLGIWDVEVLSGTRRWSDELKAMLGLPADAEATEAQLLACVHPDDRAAVARHNVTTFVSNTGAREATFRIIRRTDGQTRWIRSRGRVILDDAGAVVRRIGTFRDVTEQQATYQALNLALRRYEALIAATSEIVWHANPTQDVGDGKGWTEFTGQTPEEANGDGWLEAVHPEDRETARRTCEKALAAGAPYTNEYRLFHRESGEWRWVLDRVVPLLDDEGRLVEWVGIIADIHERKSAEAKIWTAANTDALTGLANRAMFQSRLDRAIEEARGEGRAVSLILVDLDRFKETNDSLGHDAGDHALKFVAGALRAGTPRDAVVARLGGDEFGVILPGAGEAEARGIAEGLLARIGGTLPYAGLEIDCSATVGFAVHPLHDADPAALLKNADVALYAAKSSGRGRVMAFHPAMRAELDRKLTVLRNARDALSRDAVFPFYQPKVALADGRVVGFEALLRWSDGKGLRMPGAIAEAFDDTEIAPRLGARMLAGTLADIGRWEETGVGFGHVALNLSAPEISRPGFVAGILDAVRAARIRPDRLEIEITESVLLDKDADAVLQALRALHEAGIAVYLDDFGTGFASLTHLRKYPVSGLKIDRSFVANLEADRDNRAIVQAVIAMARNMGIRVVAEGVETAWQRGFLAENGCELAQGYLFARPMAGSRVAHFVTTWAADGNSAVRDPAAVRQAG